MRACMVSFYFEPQYSGSAIQAKNLCRYLKRQGVDSMVVSARLSSEKRTEIVDGIPVHRLPVLSNKDLQIPSFWLSLSSFLLKNRHQYDVIHAHGTLQHGPVSVVGRILGKKTFLKVAMANSDIAFQRQGRIWGKVNRFYVRRFDRYIATSRQIYQEFIDQGMSEEKIVLVPNGVDTEWFRPVDSDQERVALKNELGLPAKCVISYVGMIIPRKNVDYILKVVNEVRRRGSDCHVVLVGPVDRGGGRDAGDYHDALSRYIHDSDLNGHVTFAGHQDRVDRYLRASDIFMLASKEEGMPNVLLEAMACGLPCVASRISGTEDLVDHEKTGFLLDLSEIDRFVDITERLSQDTALRRRIGAEARKLIVNRYSLDFVARRIRSLYSERLESPNSNGS